MIAYSRRALLRRCLALPALLAFAPEVFRSICRADGLEKASSLPPGRAGGTTCFDLPAETVSKRYAVTIDGKPAPVFSAALNVNFISFDATGPVAVTVQLPEDDYWVEGAVVRPLARGIKPTIKGNTLSFQVTAPAKLSVERTGTRRLHDEALLIFANRPEVLPPPRSASVISLPAGLHRRNIDLTSGQTLHLAGGAVLAGSVNVWNAENVKILGRGTILYDGPQPINKDTDGKLVRNWHPLSINNSSNVLVDGITCVTRSRTWSILNIRSQNLRFENMNIISASAHNVNGDGIDLLGCDHVAVTNCFIRSCDDAFALYEDFLGPKSDWRHRGVTDLKVTGCVFWATLANILRVGFDKTSPMTRDITFRDCDVIHLLEGGDQLKHKTGFHDPYSLVHIWVPRGKFTRLHENYLFDDIRLEDYSALIGIDAPHATFRNFRFRNITAPSSRQASIFRGRIDPREGIAFENVKVDGRSVLKLEDIPLKLVDTPSAGFSFEAS